MTSRILRKTTPILAGNPKYLTVSLDPNNHVTILLINHAVRGMCMTMF